MLEENASQFRVRLEKLGLSETVITAAWPTWWSEAADASSSARAELRYSIARKLGLEPHSLLRDDGEPDFIWKNSARFKNISEESDIERWALTSFGTALGRMLLLGTIGGAEIGKSTALSLRTKVLETQPFVRLADLISIVWALGIPTVHLRVFPLLRKRMAAMSVRVGRGNAILLGKDSQYPAQIAFYLAHELAHIYLNHVHDNEVLVDYEMSEKERGEKSDPEEVAADEFALELLTGYAKPIVLPDGSGRGPQSLAKAVLGASRDLAIEPGTLALCFGHSTGDWQTAIGSLRYIYDAPRPVWREINRIAIRQLSFSDVPLDTAYYVKNILGGAD
ncbi:MAG: ImmA/IrrE family metallo-endopeptidase [Blastocatellia bacterium]|nr:ImmA/IrrE family metallo-endopeptidase [Blastocatellia bacterium]